jgi:biotin/methionine sulfoxide reductase
MIGTLAAMLGQIGLPGRGVGFGYGCIHNFGFAGRKTLPFKTAALPQGNNPVDDFIPVARIADMLLHPGAEYTFNGETRAYPDIKLIHWAGGNPFHHHQDLNRLRRAWARPETIIVHDCFWTATARHADIVYPSTTALERHDFSNGGADLYFAPMHQVMAPFGESRDDYASLSALAGRLGCGEAFTEGRTAQQWIEYQWQITRQRAAEADIELPDFDRFWHNGQYRVDNNLLPEAGFALEQFRTDPERYPLGTPSGRIEICSERIAGFAYADCRAHPMWLDKQEFLGSDRSQQYPMALVSNQPRTRLHSQYDHGRTSRNSKIREREVARMHPDDAAARGIQDGDVVRIYNDRGACLAALKLSDAIRAGAIELPTGAWYDPQHPAQADSLEVHGNPNVLTRDAGTSQLAQATSAHSCLVQVERYDQPLPDIRVFSQPAQVAG